METQSRLVCALTITHNFIYIHDPEDLPELLEQDEHIEEGGIQGGISKTEQSRASERRDRIAADMWAAYESHRARHQQNHW